MARIAISYRRAGSRGMAGRIFDRLTAHYGDDSVFMDIENIPFGVDFREKIRDALTSVDVLLVVVGPNWAGTEPGGRVRIKEDSDLLRTEVETALLRRIPVIPVLVEDAGMPQPDDLPESIRQFAFHNAAEVDSGRDFRAHMDRLISAVDGILGGTKSGRPKPTPKIDPRTATLKLREPGQRWLTLAAYAVVAGIVVIFLYFTFAMGASDDAGLMLLHVALAMLISGGVGFAIRRLHGELGGIAALIGAAIGIIAIGTARLYQLEGNYAGLPFLAGSIAANMLQYIAAITFAALAGNFLAQSQRTESKSGLVAGFGSNAPRTLRIATAISAFAAVGAAFIAWQPYCFGFAIGALCLS